jgi:hypothetical protein
MPEGSSPLLAPSCNPVWAASAVILIRLGSVTGPTIGDVAASDGAALISGASLTKPHQPLCLPRAHLDVSEESVILSVNLLFR